MQTNNKSSASSRAGFAIESKLLPIALAIAAYATFGAAPAFAKHHHRVVHPLPALHMQASDEFGEFHSTPQRDAALRECNLQAQKFSDSAWETTKFAMYGTCMTNHDQLP